MRTATLLAAAAAACCCAVSSALPAVPPPHQLQPAAAAANAFGGKRRREGSVRLLHGSGYLPPNTFLPYWSRFAAEGAVVGMIINGNGGMEQGEASFRSRANQMSTAMEIPVERFVFIPVYGDLCPETANDPAVAALIESCDAVYMPGGNQGQLAACIYGVVSDSGVDSPEDTLAAAALRTVQLVGGDSAGAMNQPSAPMMSRHDEAWSSCFPCDTCCGESYCALTNGCVFTRDVGNRLVDDMFMIHTHVAERGRQGFLLVSIMMHLEDGVTSGIGGDEGAALYCNNDDHWCYSLADVGRGTWVYVGVTGDTALTTAVMHFLSDGDRWNSLTNEVQFADSKVPCSELLEVESSDTIFNSGFTPGVNDYRRIALEASRLPAGMAVENTHGSTFGSPPVFANFITDDTTVAMCDPSGDHQGFANMRTTQGFVAPAGWKPDLSSPLIEYSSDYRAEQEEL
eukprot:SAG22_NODE_573_length_8999_cov_9.592921_8_plen_457_part_00